MGGATPSYTHVAPSVEAIDSAVIKSAKRVLEIFEFFAEARKPSSATEIAHALSFPQSSTSMLLRSLVSLGYLHYERESRAYEPTLRLSLLGGWVPERIEIAGHIIETLNALHEDTGEIVVLAQQTRHFVRYIHILQRPEAGISYYFRPGTLRPACMSATGLMLLTLSSEREVLSILHRTNADLDDPAKRIGRTEFLAALARAREAGFACHERALEEMVGVQAAVLLPAEHDAPRLAVGVISRQPRFKQREREIMGRLLEISRGRPNASKASGGLTSRLSPGDDLARA